MTDPLINLIIEQTKSKKSVLLIGPELLTQPGQPTAAEKLLHALQKQGHAIEPDLDHFLNLKSLSGSKKRLFEIALRTYHEALPVDPLYEKLAALPFHIFLSIAPDGRLHQTFKAQHFAHDFQYYNKKVNPTDIPAEPGAAKPLLYNLFGSIDDSQSLIFTYDDLFEFIFAILGDKRLHTTFQYELRQADLFLFLGFDFDKWYVKLLLRLLFHEHENEPLPLTNHSSVADHQTRTFCINNFKMEFIQAGTGQLIAELYDQFQRLDLLRQPQLEAAMPKIDKRQQLTDLNTAYENLTEKLGQLRNAHSIETNPAVKFQLKKQIEETEAELNAVEQEIDRFSQL